MLLQQRRTIGQSSFFCLSPSHETDVAHLTYFLSFILSSYLFSAFARIENHYFINEAFMRDGQLLDVQEIDKM